MKKLILLLSLFWLINLQAGPCFSSPSYPIYYFSGGNTYIVSFIDDVQPYRNYYKKGIMGTMPYKPVPYEKVQERVEKGLLPIRPVSRK